jgi:serine O-acetyltransferase
MVLGARSIGDDVHIRQNTTFGIPRRTELSAKPIIGDRVDIGCGAVLLGHIHVGADSVIGANSVVTRDVPAGSLVVGNPARVVKSVAEAEANADAAAAASGDASARRSEVVARPDAATNAPWPARA